MDLKLYSMLRTYILRHAKIGYRIFRHILFVFVFSISINFIYVFVFLIHKHYYVDVGFELFSTLFVVLVYSVTDGYLRNLRGSRKTELTLFSVFAFFFTGFITLIYYLEMLNYHEVYYYSYKIGLLGCFLSTISIFLAIRFNVNGFYRNLGKGYKIKLIAISKLIGANENLPPLSQSTIVDLQITFLKLVGYVATFCYAYWFKLDFIIGKSTLLINDVGEFVSNYGILLIVGQIIILQGASFHQKFRNRR